MKRLSTTVKRIIKGKEQEKKIFILVDEKTAKALELFSQDELHRYIVEEHEIYLNDLKETRRHSSIEKCKEDRIEFYVPDALSIEEMAIRKEAYENLYSALSTLSDEQRYIVMEVYFNGRTQKDLATKLGVSEAAICRRFSRIYEKLRKILAFSR